MITIKRESDLEVQTWTFWYSERDHVLRLSWWRLEQRETKRHKFRVAAKYDHPSSRYNKTIPPDVLDEARRRFCETLKVEP